MLQPRVASPRIDERDEAELTDPRQPPHLGRVEKLLHAVGQWHVAFVRNADEVPPAIERANLREELERHGGSEQRSDLQKCEGASV